MFEDNLRRTVLLADGSFSVFLERPVSLLLAGLCILVWLAPLKRVFVLRRRTRRG